MGRILDVTIIGAGIVGLATAMKLSKAFPALRVAVVEKEDRPAAHQSGHNSGVIHSGVYYRPGSLKARLCVAGAAELVRFCRENDIPYDLCGKLVIATTPDEREGLRELYRRGTANGVQGLRLLDSSEAKEIEPYCSCVEALAVAATGVVDFRQVAGAYAQVFRAQGGELLFGHKILGIETAPRSILLETTRGSLETHVVLNCAGLYSDRVASLAGSTPPCRIVPFRGEYYQVKGNRDYLVRGLIYPVPDPRFPFLGVHFTRMVDGVVEAGPNAVLALAREGYGWKDISPVDLMETLSYKGFRPLASRYWNAGLMEMVRSISKSRFTQALQRLVPEIAMEDLVEGGSGVRAQALASDGSLHDDFVILFGDRMLHVLNAPSPAATASLAIADYIVREASSLISGL
ncbi:MAG: L-2-hydroxyglutarate oxidase [Syntrophobacteraceae bacterium]